MQLQDVMNLVKEHSDLAMECVLQENEELIIDLGNKKAKKFIEIMDVINPLIINSKKEI